MTKYDCFIGVRIHSELQDRIAQESRKRGLCNSSFVRSILFKEHFGGPSNEREINPQQLLEQLYAEFGHSLIDSQITRIEDWLDHWTERTSRIDYSKPHIKIIKGPFKGHLIGSWRTQFCMSY